jgi:hypothetical protein
MNRAYKYAELNNRANYEQFARRTSPVPARPVARAGTDKVYASDLSDSRGRLWQYILWLEERLVTTYWQLDEANRRERNALNAYGELHRRSEAAFEKLAAIDAVLHPKPQEGTDAPEAGA